MNTIRKGSIGPDVKAWQEIIGIKADNIFGAGTDAATRAWQHDHNLTPDGVVGNLTWAAAGIIEEPPIQGLDVSAMQGRVIPWAAEKERGCRFVWNRCQVGNETQRDVYFASNYRAAQDAGVFFGGYSFGFPLRHIDPKVAAELFVRSLTIADKGGLGPERIIGTSPGDMPPAYDLEWPAPEDWPKWKVDAASIVGWTIACLARMTELTGRKPIVYSYPWYLRALSIAPEFGELPKLYDLWLAGGQQYLNGNGAVPRKGDKPPRVHGWGDRWLAWQFDGNGGRRLVNGVDADFNVFNGGELDLLRLVRAAPASDEIPPTEAPPPLVGALPNALEEAIDASVHEYRQARAHRILAEA